MHLPMHCERFTTGVLVFLIAACSRETPAPAPAPASLPPAATTTETATRPYADALAWLKSNRGFHFVYEEAGVRAEGDMVRPTPGAERVHFKTADGEWLTGAGRTGIRWHRRSASKWERTTAPPFCTQLYQRVTLAIDPQKKEGEAQLAGPGHYHFTDANNGEAHDVWVDEKGRVTRMTIGKRISLVITSPDEPGPVTLV